MPTSVPSKNAAPHETTLFVRDHCLCLHTQRAARALARRFDEALRPLGLKSGQFSLLISLNRPEPPTLGSVARLLAMDRTTLTANLKPLERDGLLQVRPDEKDRRARRLVLTDKGRELLVLAVPVWDETHRDIEAAIGGVDADRLRGDLNRIVWER
ncbi:MarR family winged helix-turn-helix transcriptional regulator [Brucella sp. JSBI001]|uniref:MarR family winged helix-turn-helix transcriptional regulator n=1 Tax=Brucella sp. JSBI001 TaxID=2886044 RepID=UPI00222F5213|nr:MarR family transcriptional regulator [Brucella sp. JSBI001]UZD69375.1 MarR family transcriptional regulator [Brucella sp. JSBI001]